MLDLTVLVGNPRPGSRTRAVAEEIARSLAAAVAAAGHEVGSVRTLELAEIVAYTLGTSPVAPTSPVPDAVDIVRASRLLVVATPSYKGTYTGLLKIFLDQLPHLGLAEVVAVPVAVAGSPAHAEATGAALAMLLRELGADVPAVVSVLDGRITDPAYVLDEAARIVGEVVAVLDGESLKS